MTPNTLRAEEAEFAVGICNPVKPERYNVAKRPLPAVARFNGRFR